jgi:hypothetical protein
VPDTPESTLRRLFELAAEIMDIDHGQQRLELVFDDGSLRAWWTHHEKRPAGELIRFEDRAAASVRLTAAR